ncbi:P-loop containing nucleoside triphosphate hydrolase protein [Mycena metata]|uniref:P-loop containing nucleoside triphosphate hydrolase protein n=1 Tax=Mycena metata TaxID=1033252 RepID=A0AAD7HZ66_9AGAR|nr:P-loop containing nucleoside triphosphate hydrolase protein [Mycena metata]
MSTSQSSPSPASSILASSDGASSDPGGVGLSNPQLSPERRKLLDLMNRLHSTGVQTDIDLPQIVVIGSQSAGKSSLIESISGLTLPRAAGTCTRCPTECRLSCSKGPWTCIVELRYITDQDGQSLGQTRSVVFGGPIFDQAEVEDRIRRAQRAILCPTKAPHTFLTGDDNGPTEISFSTNYISLQISGLDIADLSFVDLPGLIASVSSKSGNEADIAMVESLVTSYISKPNCIILLTVACETDFENQGAHHLTKKHDPEGKRTIGVLTKPDRIPHGDEESWLSLIRNERDALENNWYCVKQPSSQDLKQGIIWSVARAREIEFFSQTSPWSELDSMYQPYLRTSNLVHRLSSILSDLISKRLPQIQLELETALQQTRASIQRLPKPPSDDAILEVTTLVHSFIRELDQMIEGVPHADGLIQTIRPAQEEFRRNIRRTAPDFRPFESGQNKGKTQRVFPDPGFLRDEEGHEHWFPPSSNEQASIPVRVPIYGREVFLFSSCFRFLFNFNQSARSRELPGHYPFAVQKAYIAEFTCNWAHPAQVLCASVQKTFSEQVKALITTHFSMFGQGSLEHRVQVVVQSFIQEQANITQAAIVEHIQYEDYGPQTLNNHYLSDYKEKFLNYYKHLRQRDRNSTLAAAIPGFNQEEEQSSISLPDAREVQYSDGDYDTSIESEAPSSYSAPFSGRSYTVQAKPPRVIAPSLSPSARITEILKHLSALDLEVRSEDLMKLCPKDPMEPAFNIMADVRAYFQVAYKRVADNIPAAIDHDLIRGVGRNILPTLMKGIGLNGPDAMRIAKDFARENPAVAGKRAELEKKLERLETASRQLLSL